MPVDQLKINSKDVDVTKLGSSFNVSSGKEGNCQQPTDRDLVMNLADDQKEVRGFGRPITPDLVKSIVLQYIEKSDKAWQLLQDIVSDKFASVSLIKDDERFQGLLSLVDPSKQILSGVFGKEIILQVIAAKGCEGLRYFIGEIEGKMTIVLMGVKDVTKPGDATAISEPISGWEYYKNGRFNSDNPTDPEVHLNSLTRADLLKVIGREKFVSYGDDDIVKALFGPY